MGGCLVFYDLYFRRKPNNLTTKQKGVRQTLITEPLESHRVSHTWGWIKVRTTKLTVSTQPRFKKYKTTLEYKNTPADYTAKKYYWKKLRLNESEAQSWPPLLLGASGKTPETMEERLWTVETKMWELTTEEVKTYLCHTKGHAIDAQNLKCSTVKLFFRSQFCNLNNFLKRTKQQKYQQPLDSFSR